MAEQATLLQKLPPIEKNPSPDGRASFAATPTPETGAEVATSSEVVASSDDGISISPFQAATYGSFALSFILAGFAAVIVYRKSLSGIEPRFANCAKILAGVLAATGLHGFVATYGYTNYLREVTESTPLSLTVLIWIILGLALGYVPNRIVEVSEKPRKGAAIIDGILFAIVFVMLTLAVSDQVSTNTAIILSLAAIIAYIVPFARFFVTCKKVKLNRRQTKRKPIRPLLNSLITLPGLLPILAILYATNTCGLDVTLFLVNLTAIGFILLISFSMLVGVSALSELAEAGETGAATAVASAAAPAAPAVPEEDPFLAELLAQPPLPAPTPAPAPKRHNPSVPTPRKPSRADLIGSQNTDNANVAQVQPKLPKAPQKPGSKKSGSDHGLKVKAPSKPGKRH